MLRANETENKIYVSTPQSNQLQGSRQFVHSFGAAKKATIALSTLALCACSAITDPYISMGTEIPATPSFEEAVTFARKQGVLLDNKLAEVEQYDVATGSFLFGTGLAALGFGAYGAHPDKLIGATIASGTAAGTRTFLPIQDRKLAYASGSAAIDCAITAFSLNAGAAPAEDGGSTSQNSRSSTAKVKEGSGQASEPIGPLWGVLKKLKATGLAASRPGNFSVAMRALEARSPVPMARSLVAATAIASSSKKKLANSIRQAERARSRLISSTESAISAQAPGLIAATAAIVHTVNAQIIAARIDPEGALKTLREHAKALTRETLTDAKELRNEAGIVEEESGETADAVNDTIEVAQQERVAAMSSNAGSAGTFAATTATAAAAASTAAATEVKEANDKMVTASEVARLAQRIHAMVAQSAACAFGPGRAPALEDSSS